MPIEIFPGEMRLESARRAASGNPDAMNTVLAEAYNDRTELHERVAVVSGRHTPRPDALASHKMGSDPYWRRLR